MDNQDAQLIAIISGTTHMMMWKTADYDRLVKLLRNWMQSRGYLVFERGEGQYVLSIAESETRHTFISFPELLQWVLNDMES